jgi:hypothetical protein
LEQPSGEHPLSLFQTTYFGIRLAKPSRDVPANVPQQLSLYFRTAAGQPFELTDRQHVTGRWLIRGHVAVRRSGFVISQS